MSEAMRQGSLGLADDQFAGILDVDEEAKMKLLQAGALGLMIDGPWNANPEVLDTIRIVGLWGATPADKARLSLFEKGIVLCSSLDTHGVYAGWLVDAPHPPRPVRHNVPVDPHDEGSMSLMTFKADLKTQVPDLPWKPGALQTWIVLWDQASNPVSTLLSAREIHDPAVIEFLGRHRRRPYSSPVAVQPGPLDLPDFRQLPESPAIPEKPGIALDIERVVLGVPGEPALLRGSFRLPVLEREHVPPRPEPDPTVEFPPPILDPWPTAVVRLSLLLTGDTSSEPLLVPLHVPVHDEIDPKDPAPVVTGFFSVDLRRETLLEDYQTYAVWAVSGAVLAGPVLMALVDPQRLDE